MLRQAKCSSNNDAWLYLDPSTIPEWASLNDIHLKNVHLARSSSHDGLGLVASRKITQEDGPLITVPRDMVLCEARVHQLASADSRLRELLKACLPWATSGRIFILLFLLYQATVSNPDVKLPTGVWRTPFAGYLSFLPIPELPTLYSETEMSLFDGTTLIPAVRAKIRKLQAEFDSLRKSTKDLEWLHDIWWNSTVSQPQLEAILAQLGVSKEENHYEDDASDCLIQFDDWLLLDAMFRSRAMEWPGEGDAMVPAVDFANHTVPANAEYKVTSEGNGEIRVNASMTINQNEEVLISYGDHKSALEFLFSYGFWPEYQFSPSILLSLPDPNEDPLGPPKVAIVSNSRSVPGIKIYEDNSLVQWDSEALWLLVINEEDGLGFKVAYGLDNERELHMTWKDSVIELGGLKKVLEQDPQWDLFQLRATVIVLQQVDVQLSKIQGASQAMMEPELQVQFNARMTYLQSVAGKLRSTEKSILDTAMHHLQQKKESLMQSQAVQQYFANLEAQNNEDMEEDDFS